LIVSFFYQCKISYTEGCVFFHCSSNLQGNTAFKLFQLAKLGYMAAWRFCN